MNNAAGVADCLNRGLLVPPCARSALMKARGSEKRRGQGCSCEIASGRGEGIIPQHHGAGRGRDPGHMVSTVGGVWTRVIAQATVGQNDRPLTPDRRFVRAQSPAGKSWL
ncbi:hypothetical protein AAFF_G00125610 [Aldrovandia affinis]|uniref:Uncharacterized protein n=1 Tax=Aldrovandia affinis TaxID=143900 RepID=A0AAD7RRS3_9TELE|nr:hypothetical protein AAFF_G00125610 [Aldrovandia affinis]